jgi:hypothetical protein
MTFTNKFEFITVHNQISNSLTRSTQLVPIGITTIWRQSSQVAKSYLADVHGITHVITSTSNNTYRVLVTVNNFVLATIYAFIT